jgi:hypothetical protein
MSDTPNAADYVRPCEHCDGRRWVPAEGHSIEHGTEPCPFCADVLGAHNGSGVSS